MKTRWIVAPLVALWCGCGGDDDGPAPIVVVDAAVDASPDAPPDAPGPSTEITAACMHVCQQVGVCLGVDPPAACVTECEADLADCTTQQVMQVDACGQADCGKDGDGVGICVQQIACVDG